MRKSLIFFQLTILASNLISQVDAYKMRHEISTHQFKKQSLGEVTQRATIIDSVSNPFPYQARLIDILDQNTELYATKSAYSMTDYYYRGQSLTNSAIYINQVALSSNIIQGHNSIFNILDNGHHENMEILYGQNIILNSSNSTAAISLFTNQKLDAKDTNTMYRSLKANYGNNSQFATLLLENNIKKGWRNNLSFLVRQNNRYNESKTIYLYSSEKNYNFQNNLEKKFSDYSKLNFYFSTSISSSNQKLSVEDSLSEIRLNSKRISPFIFSYLQWSKSSDESKWYTQLISSISYLNLTVTDSFEGYDFFFIYSNFPTYTSNKLSLQSNGFKNLGSRAVYYFGGELNAENINADYSVTNNYFIPTPIIHSNFYFKKEIRPSSDYSWIFGANIGLDQFNLQVQKPHQNTAEFLNKTFLNTSIQASWLRHLCENSNYSINLFANYNSPKLNQFIPFFKAPYYLSNLDLIAEKKINFEGNLYRKFDDKLELNFSIYYSLTKDAILTRDYNDETVNQVMVYGKEYGALQNQNVNLVSNFGIDNELKFHFSHHVLAYHTFHIQKQIIHSDDKKYSYLQTPIYGTLGLKLRFKKIFSQLWLNYNLGVNHLSKTKYDTQLSSTNTNYMTFHFSSSVQVYNQFKVQVKVDNMFNVNSYTYFSQIANMGRTASIQLTMEF